MSEFTQDPKALVNQEVDKDTSFLLAVQADHARSTFEDSLRLADHRDVSGLGGNIDREKDPFSINFGSAYQGSALFTGRPMSYDSLALKLGAMTRQPRGWNVGSTLRCGDAVMMETSQSDWTATETETDFDEGETWDNADSCGNLHVVGPGSEAFRSAPQISVVATTPPVLLKPSLSGQSRSLMGALAEIGTAREYSSLLGPRSLSQGRSPVEKHAEELEDRYLLHNLTLTSSSARSNSTRSSSKGSARFTDEQKGILWQTFEKEKHPSRQVFQELAERTGLKPRQVRVWFQNTRCRSKDKYKARRASGVQKGSQRHNSGTQFSTSSLPAAASNTLGSPSRSKVSTESTPRILAEYGELSASEDILGRASSLVASGSKTGDYDSTEMSELSYSSMMSDFSCKGLSGQALSPVQPVMQQKTAARPASDPPPPSEATGQGAGVTNPPNEAQLDGSATPNTPLSFPSPQVARATEGKEGHMRGQQTREEHHVNHMIWGNDASASGTTISSTQSTASLVDHRPGHGVDASTQTSGSFRRSPSFDRPSLAAAIPSLLEPGFSAFSADSASMLF